MSSADALRFYTDRLAEASSLGERTIALEALVDFLDGMGEQGSVHSDSHTS
jgi:hypothetical protein